IRSLTLPNCMPSPVGALFAMEASNRRPPLSTDQRPWAAKRFAGQGDLVTRRAQQRRASRSVHFVIDRPAEGNVMIELLEQQKKLTINQWKLICTANLADLLDFFDFFLIGYVTAALTKQWSLTYWEGGGILLASGLGAVPGAFFWGWLGDKIGRRTVFIMSAITISLATGIMAFTPGPDGFVPGWLFLMFFRFFVGVGNAGIFTIDLPLVQEFIPAYKRGWVSALVTTLLPGGSMLAGVASWQLLPIIGWRGLFLGGLVAL